MGTSDEDTSVLTPSLNRCSARLCLQRAAGIKSPSAWAVGRPPSSDGRGEKVLANKLRALAANTSLPKKNLARANGHDATEIGPQGFSLPPSSSQTKKSSERPIQAADGGLTARAVPHK